MEQFARSSHVWQNLINAVALEMGIAPIFNDGELVRNALAGSPAPEKSTLSRRYRKLKRNLVKHAKNKRARGRLRYNNAILKSIIIDFVEQACIKKFNAVAGHFSDLQPNAEIRNWRRHKYFFSDQEYERLLRAYETAAERLMKGEP